MDELKTFARGFLVLTVLVLLVGSLWYFFQETLIVILAVISFILTCYAAGVIWEEIL